MANYSNCVERQIPVLRKDTLNLKITAVELVSMRNAGNSDNFKVYQKDADKILEIPQTMGRRIIFVAKDQNQVEKTAVLVSKGLQINALDFDEDTYAHVCNVLDEPERLLIVVRLSVNPGQDEHILARQTLLNGAAVVDELSEGTGIGNTLFYGFQEGQLSDQLAAAVSGVATNNIMLALPPELMERPEIHKLITEKGFEVYYLKEMPDGYYREIFDQIIGENGYRFSSDRFKDQVFRALTALYGDTLSEEIMDTDLRKAAEHCGEGVLSEKDFTAFLPIPDTNAVEKLERMPGLANVKKAAKEYIDLSRACKENPALKGLLGHLLFAGDPGTGKTTAAKLFSDILASAGITNGRFVTANRASLIGNYVGHTAPKVEKVFREARGGVLFVDEAGFFMIKNTGGFVDEAIKEFVRYMEQYRGEVIVIFALYREEEEDFLALDDGLPSRISRVIRFDPYSGKELLVIFKLMMEDYGFTVSNDVTPIVSRYFGRKRENSGKAFGNAREVRKLCDAVIRLAASRSAGPKGTAGRILKQDVLKAVEELEGVSAGKELTFGFGGAFAGIPSTVMTEGGNI
ncbi:MAG: AAA family ATPase [Lachnospiraceae bacterium]|nr:AAA family ATPase [Lachnospiraceae bacterium]